MKKLKILWLDDQREPNKYFKPSSKKQESGAWIRNNEYYQNNIFNNYDVEFVWVRNLEEFSNYIQKNGIPQFVSFDFDLTPKGYQGNDFPNGGECAKWLINYCKNNGLQMPKCFAHTANGKQRPLLNSILGLNEDRKKKIIITESMYNTIITKQ